MPLDVVLLALSDNLPLDDAMYGLRHLLLNPTKSVISMLSQCANDGVGDVLLQPNFMSNDYMNAARGYNSRHRDDDMMPFATVPDSSGIFSPMMTLIQRFHPVLDVVIRRLTMNVGACQGLLMEVCVSFAAYYKSHPYPITAVYNLLSYCYSSLIALPDVRRAIASCMFTGIACVAPSVMEYVYGNSPFNVEKYITDLVTRISSLSGDVKRAAAQWNDASWSIDSFTDEYLALDKRSQMITAIEMMVMPMKASDVLRRVISHVITGCGNEVACVAGMMVALLPIEQCKSALYDAVYDIVSGISKYVN